LEENHEEEPMSENSEIEMVCNNEEEFRRCGEEIA